MHGSRPASRPGAGCREKILQGQIVITVCHFGLLGYGQLAQAALDIKQQLTTCKCGCEEGGGV